MTLKEHIDLLALLKEHVEWLELNFKAHPEAAKAIRIELRNLLKNPWYMPYPADLTHNRAIQCRARGHITQLFHNELSPSKCEHCADEGFRATYTEEE